MRLACLLVCVATISCNASTGGGDCTTAGNALCKRASACADGGVARFVQGDITFGSESQCNTAYVLGCQHNEDAGLIDYVACGEAALTAPCAMSPNGGGVEVPSACLQ
jgi:hypothetical protein